MTDTSDNQDLSTWPPMTTGLIGVDQAIERARQLRAQQVRTWLSHLMANLRSLWRRPGPAAPVTMRDGKARA
jgi:hypothetical protein